MNDFGYIDYKRPIEPKEDMRTSTYLGHRYMNENMLGNTMNVKISKTKHYQDDPVLSNMRTSDYKANFKWQYDDPFKIGNPSLDRKVQFMQSFVDCKMRFIKRPLRPAISVSHQDFHRHANERIEPVAPMAIPLMAENTKIVIDYSKPGCSKYLDPSATTTKLDYAAYNPDDLMKGVAAHDHITFWNWPEKTNVSKKVCSAKDETMCDKLAAKECPKRRCEFPSLIKPVPHSGLTTEVRANYMEPIKRAVEFDLTYIKNEAVYLPVVPSPTDTESKLYGSGERTQKYV